MQYVSIKQVKNSETGIEKYLVPALTLKNAKGEMKQRIPHPLGDTYLEYPTLEEAINSVKLSGFKCMLQDGTEIAIQKPVSQAVDKDKTYDEMVFEALISQTKDMNSTVVAAALTALGQLGDMQLLELFIEKMGEDNDAIRTSAMNSVVALSGLAVKRLLAALKDENWVRRNSALICLQRLVESESVQPEKLFVPLIEMTKDKNSIVKTSAITALGKAFSVYKKHNQM